MRNYVGSSELVSLMSLAAAVVRNLVGVDVVAVGKEVEEIREWCRRLLVAEDRTGDSEKKYVS